MSSEIKVLLFIFCGVKLALHLMADFHSGFQGDELLHIETGNHLNFGYMEFPPMIGILAFFQNLFNSDSVLIHHLFAHVASLLILIYTAKTTVVLGGKAKAVFLVLLCIIIGPGFGRSQQLFQPVVFSQLFWVLSFYHLIKYVKVPEARQLWFLTITVGLGLLTKYDILFFIAGLPVLFLFRKTRQSLIEHKFWLPILLVFVLVLPNIIWQFYNDLPVLQMMNRLYETQLNDLTVAGVLWKLILSINPLSLLLLIPAIIYLFSSKDEKSYLPIASTILISVFLLILSQGKSYYFFPIVLTLLPFGGVFWEKRVLNKKKPVFYPLTVLLLLGIVLIPFGMPVYSLEKYLKYDYPFEKNKIEGGKYGVHFEERYSKQKWEETMNHLLVVYDSLPASEKENALIWGKHYGQAGAVNLLGRAHQLPQAFSYHGSFYSWAPIGEMPQVLIAFSYGDAGIDFFQSFFEEVKPVRKIYNPYADEESRLWQTIYVCKNPIQDFDGMKLLFKKRIFE